MLAVIIIGAIVLIIYIIASSQPAPATISNLTVSPDLIAKSGTITTPPSGIITTPPVSQSIDVGSMTQALTAAKQKIGIGIVKVTGSNWVELTNKLGAVAQGIGETQNATTWAKVITSAPKASNAVEKQKASGFFQNAVSSLVNQIKTVDTYKTPEPLKQIIINTPTVEPPKPGIVTVTKAMNNLQPSTINPKLKLTAQV